MAEGGGRGRGAQLLAAMQRRKEELKQKAAEAPSASVSEIPGGANAAAKTRGRGALLLEALEKRRTTALPSPASEPLAEATPTTLKYKEKVEQKPSRDEIEAVAEHVKKIRMADPEEEKKPRYYKGEAGSQIPLSVNYIKLNVEEGKGVYEYEVKFHPELDAKNQRIRVVNQIMLELSSAKVFDGGARLYLPDKITDTQKVFDSAVPGSELPVIVTVIYKKKKHFGDRECLHLFNVLFKRIMHVLLYYQVGRSYYQAEHKTMIPQHKLEVYPGFAVSVDELEGGLLLCLDTQHRVLRNQTAYELMNELKCASGGRPFKDDIHRTFLGACVFTRYNNRTYRIDDILWNMTPNDDFATKDGGKITFIQYYKQHYNITINDHNQPLLLNRQSVNVPGALEKEDRMICLIPELCYMTGLTDAMRSNFKLMKDVAVYTKVTPQQRLFALSKYLENVRGNEKVQEILKNWGLSVDSTSINLSGRKLDNEMIIFGNNVEKPAGPNADWNREILNNHVTGPIHLRHWVIFYTAQDMPRAKEFVQQMQRLSETMGFIVLAPKRVQLANDLTHTYANIVRPEISNPQTQLAVFISPSLRADRYSIIKKICCVQKPIASQVILSKTLSRPDKIRAIVTKIALQINCKLGGSLWSLRFPFRGWMICGIDVYHDKASNHAVCGFVSSVNDSLTQWFSLSNFQTQELGDFLKYAFAKSLERYKNEQTFYPKNAIIIRDGVGDGQLDYCLNYEVDQFQTVLNEFKIETKICFVIVQKRINTRIFRQGPRGEVTNPPPGTILDHSVTRKFLYDFFLIPQNVREGTVNPTHYIVLHDTCKLKPDHVQRLCYKLCHLYYNWPGTIRVPAPCQYAHKLAGMVGQTLKTNPAHELQDTLWYL